MNNNCLNHKISRELISLLKKSLILDKSKSDIIKFFSFSKIIFLFQIVLVILPSSPADAAATLLFKSNFGAGISLGAPRNLNSNGRGAWQDILGTDQETGFSWPVSALGSDFTGIQLITVDPVTLDTIDAYIKNEMRTVPGPAGIPVKSVFQNVLIKAPVGETGSQAPFMIRRPTNIGDVTVLYLTYWFKFSADMPNKLDDTVTNGNWRNLFEVKSGGQGGIASAGDYRMIINVVKKNGALHWLTRGDNEANGSYPKTEFWRQANYTVPVPVDRWFKVEIFWRRAAAPNNGRFWAAIDGQEIVDYFGPNMGEDNLPITRIMVHNAYSGGNPSLEGHTTGLEIWSGFPCGSGNSCYDYTPPTTPTGLSATLNNLKTSVSLSWNASTDNVAVAGYYVFRNGVKIGVTKNLNFVDNFSGLTGTKYDYTVKAVDTTGNKSQSSSIVSVVY